MAAHTSRDWMSVAETARVLDVANTTIYRLVNTGALPGYKIGKCIRVLKVDFDAYLQRCRIKPGDLNHLLPPAEGTKRAFRRPSS